VTAATDRPVRLLGVDASPHGPGRTHQALESMLSAAADAGAETTLLRHDDASVLEEVGRCDGVVLGSPTYRGSPASALRLLLENIPRDPDGNGPLAGKAAAVLLTGSAPEHFFATREASGVLRGYFGCQVLSPDLHLSGKFFEDGELTSSSRELLRTTGLALVELAGAVRGSRHIQHLRPLV
jgi:FMN reductase